VLENHRSRLRWIAIILVLFLILGQTTLAQNRAEDRKILALEDAVDFALKNYPAVRASLERVRAAQAGIGLAQTNYLPRADVVWQTNRATDNNITGLLLPQSIISPISGPVPASTSNRSAWGSAAGLLFSWEPFDFGYRGAKVDAARATRDRANAEASLNAPRCGGRHSERLPDGAGCPANGARRRGGCRSARHVRQGCPGAG